MAQQIFIFDSNQRSSSFNVIQFIFPLHF